MPYRENAYRPCDEPAAAVDDDVEVGPVMFRAPESTQARGSLVVLWFAGVLSAIGVITGFAAWHH